MVDGKPKEQEGRLGRADRAAPSGVRFIALFVLTAAAGTLWAISSPLMSVPDEPAHTVKAVAVWRGEFKGRLIALPDRPDGTEAGHTYGVEIPKSYASANGLPSCYAFFPDIAANCAPDLDTSGELVDATTLAGAYPPLYYLLVGWPSRLLDADVGIYLMRVMSALVTAGLLTLGAWALARVVRWPLVLLAVALAGTPEVFYLGGSINPNSLEIASGFALWCSALAVFLRWRRNGPIDRGPVVVLVVSAMLMAHTRSLSPLFAAVILVGVAAFVGRRRLLELVADRRAWMLGGGLAVGMATALIWILSSGHLSAVTGGHHFDASDNVVLMLGSMTDDWFAGMVAFFGWTDTGPVLPAVWIWLGSVSVVVSIALLTGRRWRSFMLGLLVAVAAFAPVALQYPAAKDGMVIWQGRYFLPIAVGVPVLAAVVLSESTLFANVSRRLLLGVTSFLLIGQVSAHMAATRRYVAGIRGRLNYFSQIRWSPPVSPLVLAVLTVVVFGGFVVLAALSGAEPTTVSDGPDDDLGTDAGDDVVVIPAVAPEPVEAGRPD